MRRVTNSVNKMSAGLSIPQDVLERALGWAAQQRFESVDVEAITMLTTKEAAEKLKITPKVFRKLAGDHFDFGERRFRWSLKDIRAIAEKRRVKARA